MQDQALIGQTVGSYKVVSKIGDGGMGAVYLAEHPLIGKKVAIKTLHEEYTSNRDIVDRFFREAKAVTTIGHPNIVDVLDFGALQRPDAPPLVYIIMEYLVGMPLSRAIRQAQALPPWRVVRIAAQVVDALAVAHRKGVVHRDLKPDNIYLVDRPQQDDFTKVLDFGIAKLLGDTGSGNQTRTGIVMGTPRYMSPEQGEGASIDHRSDIYSLGVVLYQALTGRPPFTGEGYGSLLIQHLTTPPTPPSQVRSGIPPALEQVVLCMLAKKREDRYQSMEEVHAALLDPQLIGQLGPIPMPVMTAGGFAAAMLSGAMPITPSMTPAPGTSPPAQWPLPPPPLTPPPRSRADLTPPPAFAAGPGTVPPLARSEFSTISAGSGELAAPARGRSRGPLVLGAAVAAVVAGAVAVVLLGGGSGGDRNKPGPGLKVAVVAGPPGGSAVPVTPRLPDAAAAAPASGTPGTPPDAAAAPDAPPVAGTGGSTPAGDDGGRGDGDRPATLRATVAIAVQSVPPGADVFVDGKPISRGTTPLRFELPRGSGHVELTISLPGYRDARRKISVRRDSSLKVNLSKKEAPGTTGAGVADDLLAPKL